MNGIQGVWRRVAAAVSGFRREAGLVATALVGVALIGACQARATPRGDDAAPLGEPRGEVQRDAVAAPRERLFPELALTSHYARWEGRYSSQGVGGRFRWEPLTWLGVEGLAEVVFAESAEGSRVDIPIGSQVYFPYELLPRLRVRGLLGLCAMVSMSRGKAANAADADDLQIGVKAGGGLEVALGGSWMAYGDLAWQRYLGHGRKVSVWSDALDGSLTPVDHLTLAIGLGVAI